MKKNILVFSNTDRSRVYFRYLNLYNVEFYSEGMDISGFGMAVIDFGSKGEAIAGANTIRSQKSNMPLLVVWDFEKKLPLNLFKNMEGYGVVNIHHYSENSIERLIDDVEATLHPQYPQRKNEMAIVIPVYNEKARMIHVKNFLEKTYSLVQEEFINACIYFVNDGSSDGTEKLIDDMVEEKISQSAYVFKKLILSSKSLGRNTKKAGTYIEAIKSINSDVILFVDADDSFSTSDISRLLNIVNEGYYDMAIGTKDETAKGRPLLRRGISSAKRALTAPLLPRGVYDSQTGLKAVSGNAARYIYPYLNEDSGLAIDLEILYVAKKLGLRVAQVPVDCEDRDGSHINLVRDSMQFLKSMLKIYVRNRRI
ncbi:glycosyltransferase [Peptoclostridium litorale]|uniref:glycosyltransferase n=1 Tax=Peptoclostridium litorale TaxID=1557 RepID=UPI0006977BA0|nr:glycosyltransferase [Peptoclostridium litorale]